jgi:hypothetical protein
MAETEQKGAASSRDRLRSAEVASALHVLKGAMVKVLNTPMTITTKYDAKDKGKHRKSDLDLKMRNKPYYYNNG